MTVKKISKIAQSKSKTFILSCLFFLLGISVGSFSDVWGGYLEYTEVLCGLALLLSVSTNLKREIKLIIVCFLLFGLGILRCGYFWEAGAVDYSDGQNVNIVAYIKAEPDIRQDGVRYIAKVLSVEEEAQEDKENAASLSTYEDLIEKRIYFKQELYPRFSYGDEVNLSCKLRRPEPVEDFRYDMYLAKQNIFVLCSNARAYISKEGEHGNPILKSIFFVKGKVATQINRLWHEPYAGFMAGLLYGYRGGLGSLNDLFAITGVTHIIAISGYNITLLATILLSISSYSGIKRQNAYGFIFVSIIAFVIFAGASASVVRAGIMGLLVLTARQIGRQNAFLNVLMLTAVLMSLHSPLVLVWDAGFQLSFLATMGLVYLMPLVDEKLLFITEKLAFRETVSSTIAATIVTLPLILYQFGRLSIVAVVVNVLILWALPWIMLFGFFALVTSIFSKFFALLFVTLSWLGMFYIVKVVSFFAEVPFAAVDINISLVSGAFLYLLMIIFYKIKKGPG